MDLPSDSDESDVDFVPGKEESLSEESETEADKETDTQYEHELTKKQEKRLKGSSLKNKRKRMKMSLDKDSATENINTTKDKIIDPVLEKKHEDDLWASFLGPDQPKPKITKTVPKQNDTEINSLNDIFDTNTEEKPSINDDSCNLNKELTPSDLTETKSDATVLPSSSVRTRIPTKVGGSGLSSILGKIGKKDKLSTLEKSKLDWNSFKKNEGLEEEIVTHNRGRHGFLERQDFLQRTDLRQFEIEKDLRTNKRSNR